TMASRFERIGDRHAGIDRHPGSLAGLIELAERQLAEGHGDAPWPPHYRKQPGEASRVSPSRRRAPTSPRQGDDGPSKLQRRRKHPLVEIGRARKKADALAGLQRWKAN